LGKSFSWNKATEDTLPHIYNSHDFLFHYQNNKIVDSLQTSVLNVIYKKFLHGSKPQPVTFYQLQMGNWEKISMNVYFNLYGIDSVTLKQLSAPKQILKVTKKPPIWYYQGIEGTWCNFSNKVNLLLYEAQKKKSSIFKMARTR